jgi:EEF1A lysine methyltransferase 4
VIDKACIDAILSGYAGEEQAMEYLNEVYRVLKPGGVFALVSYRPPESRNRLLSRFKWSINSHRVYKPVHAVEL